MPITLDSEKTETSIIVQEEKKTVIFDKIKTAMVSWDYESSILTVFYRRFLNGVILDERVNKIVFSKQDYLDIKQALPNGTINLGKNLKRECNKKIKSILNLTGTVS